MLENVIDNSVLHNKILDLKDNLMLMEDGSVFALYEIPAHIMNMVDDKKKERLKHGTSYAIGNLQPYEDFDIAMVPFPLDLENKYLQLSKDIADDDTADFAYYMLDKSYTSLYANQELYEYHYFMSIPLKSLSISIDLKKVLKTTLDSTVRGFAKFLGQGISVLEGWEKDYSLMVEELEKQLTSLKPIRLTTKENIFINSYFYIRGLDIDREHQVKLVESYIDNIDDVSVSYENYNILTIHCEDRKHYIAMLPLAYEPENMSYLHLIEQIHSFNFPVEVFTKAKFAKTKGTPFNNIRFKVRQARKFLKNTEEESFEADSVDKKSTSRSKYLVEDAEQKIDEKVPMLNYLQTFLVFDNDLDVLKRKIDIIVDALKFCKIRLSRATADQFYLYYKNRFGTILEPQDKNFIQPVEIDGFCENLFFIDRKIGQDIGFYLGRIDSEMDSWVADPDEALKASNKLFFLNPFQANKVGIKGKANSNPNTQLSGDTGEGKSFAAKLIHLYSSFLKVKTLYIDPKLEMEANYKRVLKEFEEQDVYPEIQKYIRSLSFATLDSTKNENLGVLDPLVFLPKKRAKGLIVSMIGELIKYDSHISFKTELSHQLSLFADRRARGEQVGTLTVLKELYNHSERQDVRDTAESLIEDIKDSILGLVFSDGKNQAVDLNARNVILSVSGLDLPQDDSIVHSDLTLQQRYSLVIMYALGEFVIQFAERDYKEHTLEIVDEAWFLETSAVGRGIFNRMKRLNRRFNNFLYFVSQEIDDSNRGKDEKTAFGSYFCFRNDDSTKVDSILRRLGVQPTEESRKWFDNLSLGQCLYRDSANRVERVTFDGLFPEVKELFKTVENDSLEAI
ncbi:ATP-binding protein [Streptococcus mutans]|nr:ATP-binding protein [Streptococcus mutans]MCB5005960.1 ATP-binding protein [Streptococcus mutans]MCB5029793.1 ATP-binding protein [Streptococcus mutans]